MVQFFGGKVKHGEPFIVPIVIESFSDRHIAGVRDFNKRISHGGMPSRFLGIACFAWLPCSDAIPLYQEFVAVEGQSVRGGYILRQQAFVCNGKTTTIAGYQLPVSERRIRLIYLP
jgi:hypothetical protein